MMPEPVDFETWFARSLVAAQSGGTFRSTSSSRRTGPVAGTTTLYDFVPTLGVLHGYVVHPDGSPRDAKIYAMLRDDWPANEARLLAASGT